MLQWESPVFPQLMLRVSGTGPFFKHTQNKFRGGLPSSQPQFRGYFHLDECLLSQCTLGGYVGGRMTSKLALIQYTLKLTRGRLLCVQGLTRISHEQCVNFLKVFSL
jgi:hypothetical protein